MTVREVTPAEARELMIRGAVLVDVRDAPELLAGMAQGAVHVPRCDLAARVPELAPDRDRTLLLMCASGVRSQLAATQLAALGYVDVRSLAGGFTRWRGEGLPTTLPRVVGDLDTERYARQLALPEVGEAGQRRLQDARVLLIGAGGLGSPAALYLAAAGVGHLTLLDDDRVERSNLQRQVLHRDAEVGALKIRSGATTLRGLNPRVEVIGLEARLASSNARALLDGQQVVLDGSDNFATRYAANDACVALGIPCVHGSVFRFEGQVTVLWPARPGSAGPCYRCLYPEPPPPALAPSCAEAGVLGIVPGIIGSLQAAEALKLLLGIGEPLVGRMLRYDALQARFEEFEVPRDPRCPVCAR
ncbi:MAG TPA: molybdopterin-synthase adenylyltransferase MoeB [Steroidobacteraceae bacterium]|nr:molybdopterin-synthase adenylyltransferase MoeB [Steroidobacteraceae bacterium]